MNDLTVIEQAVSLYGETAAVTVEDLLVELYTLRAKAAAWDRLATLAQQQDAQQLGILDVPVRDKLPTAEPTTAL